MPPKDKFDDGFAEMLPVAPSAGIGHNKGPEWLPVGAELEKNLTTTHAKVLARADELRGKAGSFKKVASVAELKKATEYVAQLQEVLAQLEAARTAERAPYNVALGQIRGILGDPFDAAEAIKRATESLMNTWNQKVLREERARREEELAAKRRAADAAKRIQDAADAAAAATRRKAQQAIEDAARKAAEAKKPKPAAAPPKAVIRAIEKADTAERVATRARDVVDDAKADVTNAQRATGAKAADLTRARSPNALQSGQEFVDFRELDTAKIDLELLRPFLERAHIEQAVRAYIRTHGDEVKLDIRNRRQAMKGVEFFINLRTRVAR